MITHKINGADISDWDSFHDVFTKLFDFPDYYGRNMDAWNDCMSDLGAEGEIISILLENVTELKKTNLDIFEALVECSAFVNYRFTSEGGSPLITLSYHV
ncbi:MAG: barstar family protein [Candidatus Thiodiazotropha taylori]|nr:barstar family protein [Candidatus Thiodiazotropha taylori]